MSRIKVLETYSSMDKKGKLGPLGKERFRELLDKWNKYSLVKKWKKENAS